MVRVPERAMATAKVTFVDSVGTRSTVEGNLGESLLDVAHRHDVDIEGACGGELACSTCHITMSQEWYDKVLTLNSKTEEEDDMLDLAWGLTETSRLGCQVLLHKDLDGLEVQIPDETDNMMP